MRSTLDDGERGQSEAPLASGSRLGKYELVRRLAVGGMAEIFLARSVGIEQFEKVVVLKSILGQHASDPEFVRMFLDEARLAATLHHPNVVQVFDIGHANDQHFFTMEYVEGQDLRRILLVLQQRRMDMPLEHAVAIGIGVAAGLHYAHERTSSHAEPLGIVHRDVSPSNILVSYDGAVKVVDFGISKAATHKGATRTGFIKGKVACMSPEQCRGETVDRRSDIFAIGIVLYQLTTGKRPFEGDNDYAILHQIVDKDVAPPSSHRFDYPPALEAIVLRALQRNRDDRYATAQELQIDLENFARDHQLLTSPIELSRFMADLFDDVRTTGEALDGTTSPSKSAAFLRPAPRAGYRNPVAIALVAIVVAMFGWLVTRPARVALPVTAEMTAPASTSSWVAPPLAAVAPVTAIAAQPSSTVVAATPSAAAVVRAPKKATPRVRANTKMRPAEPDLDAPFPH